ncbi:MAG: 1-hydroxycarotenoid 3,4-desaturase CrtD [Pseudomonadota bacterium]
MTGQTNHTVVVGAGIGGLSAALDLARQGQRVTVFERHAAPGGKLRTVNSAAGPVDAGPTVFTLRSVFEALFADAGARLSDHLELHPADILARHFWPDGATLDLFSDTERSAEAIAALSGARDAAAFRAFHARTAYLFDALDAPMMRAPRPHPLGLMRTLGAQMPGLVRAAAPLRSMWSQLQQEFEDPRLRQLFARYATYIGGSPFLSPAHLTLIWQAEARGVQLVAGGMAKLAEALETLSKDRGVLFHYGADVDQILVGDGRARGVSLSTGEAFLADSVIFNGDPAALGSGALGAGVTRAARARAPAQRSLSAYVWAFAAEARGRPLAHHNVFFGGDYAQEFRDLFGIRRVPQDPTIYLCAQDRGIAEGPAAGPERFQIIMNAPADGDCVVPTDEEIQRCETRTFARLSAAGVMLDRPGPEALTTPWDFHRMFPATGGALYGANPHGMMASFRRPTARTQIKGLYLAGGGTHPGPGVPMAALSGRHAAAAIVGDRVSTSTSRQTGMLGGMSMGSAMTEHAGSRSSVLSGLSFLRIIAGRDERRP